MTTLPATPVTLASNAEDLAAAEAVRAHHTVLAQRLSELVGRLLDTAAGGDDTAVRDATDATAAVVAFCRDELLPHAAAEEPTLYAAAAADPRARLLVEAMTAEHHRISDLVRSIGTAPSPLVAASEARALQVLFEVHLVKENDLVLPLLAESPGVSLASLLEGMHDLVGAADDHPGPGHDEHGHDEHGHDEHGHDEHGHESQGQRGPGPGHQGSCGCGGRQATAVPELDARSIPHSLRHAAVFGALESLTSGSALVLAAPHDPVPLLDQLSRRRPGWFEVTYQESGPETWRLLMTRR
jgi:uncharacterized protein (DUF2249 family)